LETSGTQYLDTGIPINSKYDMELTWQNIKYVADKWATGIWTGYGKPAIQLTGMYYQDSNKVCPVMYDVDYDSAVGSNEASIPFDTEIHTTYCYKGKGIWIDDESTLKPADYELEFPSNYNFLVGARQPSANYRWTGRIYSFVFKDNGQIMAEFIPAYDTQTHEYGMFETVSNKFFGNLGGGAFAGGEITNDVFPCTNAPANAHYTGGGADNDCPWECDTDYARTTSDNCAKLCTGTAKLRTDTISLNMYSEQTTHPSVALQYKNQVCYVRMQPGKKSNAINLVYKDTIYHLTN